MANEAEQAIYQRLASAPLFHPASVELLPEDWGIETGDVVSVKSGEETYNVPVYSHTLVWNGKSKATIESTGNQEREPLPELRRKEYQQGHATYTGFKANKQEIDDHWQHVTQVTDKGMSDSFGIIGVKIGADGMPMKDASGNYIWDDTGTGGEIWGHLNRTAWTTQIVNHIKDANGKIISLGEVTTDAYGNVIINAINDQRTGTATINANRVNINGDVKISDVLDISNGALWVKRMALFGPYGGTEEQYISINNGTLQAPTVQVNSGGTFKIVGSSGNYKALTYTDFLRFVTGFDAAQEINGEIIIPYHTVQSGQSTAADTINFNIAATQYYIDGVAAAYANAVNRVSWPTTPRTQSSFSVSVPGNPWNASAETGTTLNRIFALSAGSFDSNHISTVELAMSHNENGQAVTDGVVAKIDVDASGVYTDGQNSVTLSQAVPSNGFVRVSASNGEYEDVVWRTAASISAIVLSAGDAGQVVTKYPYVTYSNGDVSSSLAISVDATAISGGGAASSSIDLANAGQIYLHSADPGAGYVNLGNLGDRITEGKANGSAYVSFQATCDGGATYKYYKIPL